jgi:hypothetical protein
VTIQKFKGHLHCPYFSEYVINSMNPYLLILVVVVVMGLVYRNYQQSKQIKALNVRMNELEVRIVVRLEDRVSCNEESIQILEHAHALNACLLKGENHD